MAFSRVYAQAVNRPLCVVKIADVANVTAVPRNETSKYCNYKLNQASEVAYFDAPDNTTFTTSDYVVLNNDQRNGFMTGATYDAGYVAVT